MNSMEKLEILKFMKHGWEKLKVVYQQYILGLMSSKSLGGRVLPSAAHILKLGRYKED